MAYGHNISISVDHFINTVSYPIELPEYAIRKHEVFLSGELEPFSIPDKNTMVLTRATIAAMIDYTDRVIKFRILEANDIIEINTYVEDYILKLNQFTEVEEAVAYAAKARHFKDKLQQSITILSKRDPKLMKQLRANALMSIFKASTEVIPL